MFAFRGPKILDFGDPWGYGTTPKRTEDKSGTHMYHQAKCHADWRHRYWDTCPLHKKATAEDTYDKTHTSVALVV